MKVSRVSALAPQFLLLASMTTIVDFASTQENLTREEMIRQLEAWAETQVGDIDIRGRVFSSNGMPLNDVTVTYNFREFGDIVAETEINEESLKADGSFRITREGVSSVNVWVGKLGYYAERWSFVFNEETPRSNPGGFERVDIEFVLEKKPVSAPLVKYVGILRTDASGPVSVVEVERRGSGEAWLRRKDTRKELPWPYVFLAGGEADGSELPISEFTVSDSRRRLGLEAGSIQLENCGEGDGFIVRKGIKAPPSRDEIGLRQLLEAPENGYSNRLEVAATDDNPETIYFYCKVDGQFGKGFVSGRPIIAEEEGRQVARAKILIYLNPTGSRDVSYTHY